MPSRKKQPLTRASRWEEENLNPIIAAFLPQNSGAALRANIRDCLAFWIAVVASLYSLAILLAFSLIWLLGDAGRDWVWSPIFWTTPFLLGTVVAWMTMCVCQDIGNVQSVNTWH